MPLIEVRTSELHAFELGALLTSCLAYPGTNEEELRWHNFGHLASAALQTHFDQHPDQADKPFAIKPMYAFRNAARGQFGPKRLEARLHRRTQAGDWAIPFLIEAETGEQRLRGDMQRLTREEADLHWAMQYNLKDTRSVRQHRSETMPVMHLACALCAILQEFRRSGADASYLNLIMETGATADWFNRSILLEPLVRQAFPTQTEKSQLRIRLV